MMTAWLEDAGIEGRYGVLEIPPERFADTVRLAAEIGMAGLNVTVPHKIAALSLADEVTDAARAVGAANLLTFETGGRIRADNTDIAGIEAALAEDPGGPAVVVGAGGAARAALYHLSRQSREVRIVNRTVDKAQALAAEFGLDARVMMKAGSSMMEGAGLVINATTLGMAGQPDLSPDLSPCAPEALVFDMVYAPLETPLLASARRAGLRTADGLTMLIGQAVPSFEAFFGVRPPGTGRVRALLEARLEARS